jgi:hypothetical protein
MLRIPYNILLPVLMLISCTHSNDSLQAQGQKISQFERAGLCDFLIDKSGTYHVVFQESPANGKPLFIYYSSSTNKGASWSKPVTVSNDNTGNGSGYTRILQDGSGQIYAIWKRYGNTARQYPVPEVTLDGPGGYGMGTLFYKVLNGGAWSNAVQLNEAEEAQESWFATVTPKGKLNVFWTQLSNESIKSKQNMWYYCDFLRMAELNGTSHSAFMNLSTPAAPAPGGYPSSKEGGINLDGYVDNNNSVHFIYEDNPDGVQQLKYYDGKTERIVYRYPKYSEGNTFHNPAKLLVDEKGNDHVIFVPSASTLESEQIWDVNLATNKTNILTQIQKQGVKISGFQANQGPNGAMAVTIEAGAYSDNTEAFGIFYQNGIWKNAALTKNASKEKFFYKEFPSVLNQRTYLSTLTRYNSTFNSIAYDAQGRKSMVMNISAYWTSGAYSTASPSILFSPID